MGERTPSGEISRQFQSLFRNTKGRYVERIVRYVAGVVMLLGGVILLCVLGAMWSKNPDPPWSLGVFALICAAAGVFCFLPDKSRQQPTSPDLQDKATAAIAKDKSQATVSPERVRQFAIYSIGSGAVLAAASALGISLPRLQGAPMAVGVGVGLTLMALGAIALIFSRNQAGADAGYTVARIALLSILLACLGIPILLVALLLVATAVAWIKGGP